MTDRRRRKTRTGIVVSDARDKTVTVEVGTQSRHPRYDKVVRKRRLFHAHDPENEAQIGDKVMIVETRPISKTKHWRVEKIVERAR